MLVVLTSPHGWANRSGMAAALTPWGWEQLAAEAGRQHGTSHQQLLSGEKEGGTRRSFIKMPQPGANPVPADITSTRSQICML